MHSNNREIENRNIKIINTFLCHSIYIIIFHQMEIIYILDICKGEGSCFMFMELTEMNERVTYICVVQNGMDDESATRRKMFV